MNFASGRLGALLAAATMTLSLSGCTAGISLTDPTRKFTQYGAIGSLGLPGLTYDIAVGNGFVYQNYIVIGSGTNIVFVDRAERVGSVLNAQPVARIEYPQGGAGIFPYPRQPFSLSLTRDSKLYVGVLSASPATTPHTVEKYDAAAVTADGKLTRVAWDPLAANPGLTFNFTQPVGLPILGGEESLTANPDFIPPKYCVVTDRNGDVYVVDETGNGTGIYQVRKFRGDDATLDSGFGSGGRVVIGPFGNIALDKDGNIYVAYTEMGAGPLSPARAGVRRFSSRGVSDTAFSNAVTTLELASTNRYDSVSDVEVVDEEGSRAIYVLEYRATSGARQSIVHVLDNAGQRLYAFEPQLDGKGIETRNIAARDRDNLFFNIAFGAFYADSGGWSRYNASAETAARHVGKP